MINKEKIKELIYELILAIGDDPQREGLKDTPSRVAEMYAEIFSGMDSSPKEAIKIFNEPQQHHELVVVKNIPMYSVCEHHFLPFIGSAHIAYIPQNGKIIGLSKFSRIVNCFSKRPQVQERLTAQIADFIFSEVNPCGVAVVIEAEHLCMTMRGVKAAGAKTQTSALRGIMRTDAKSRAEVMTLLTKGE